MERLRACGRVSHLPGGSVAVRVNGEGQAGYAGLTSCGSVWACPVCNAKAMARKSLEIGTAVAMHQAQGGEVAFSTFTTRHHAGHGLGELWDGLGSAWGRVTAGKAWQTDQDRYGVHGFMRAVEVTTGRNGWHPHAHALLFLDRDPGADGLAQLHSRMVGRWSRRLVGLGLPEPLAKGQESHLLRDGADADLARYLTKSTDSAHRISLEITQSQTKTGRGAHGTRSTWCLLDDLVATGDASALDRWHEWERVSKGRKQMTWSKGLRRELGLDVEKTDEEIVAEEHGSADDDLVLIDSEGWATLRRNPVDLADLLTLTERGGLAYVRIFLDARGVTYRVVGE